MSADGKRVAPQIDPTTGQQYGLRDFSWHYGSQASDGNPSDDPCAKTGHPVDLSTGVKIEEMTDVSFGGPRGMVALTRIYTSDLAITGAIGRFGRGTKGKFDLKLTGDFVQGGAGRLAWPE